MSDVAIGDRDLSELEAVIELGMTTFVSVGTALAEIRDRRLYRETHPTFDAYCMQRWGFERAHAYRMIEAATITASLSPTGDTPLPTRESQVRELVRVEPEHRAETWQAVIEEHGPEATATEIRDIVYRQPITTLRDAVRQRAIESDAMVARVLDTDDMRVGRLRVQFFRESKHAWELIQLKPDAIGSVLETEELPMVRMQIRDTRIWLDELEQAIEPRGLRVVN